MRCGGVYDRQPTHLRDGFTLLELLLALAIFVVASAILVVNVASYFDQRELDSAAEQVRQAILETRTRAIRQGSRYEIEFLTTPGTWSVYATHPEPVDSFRPAETTVDEFGRVIVAEGKLEDGVRFVSDSDLVRISVAPQTEVSQHPATIELADEWDRGRRIRYRPIIGEVLVTQTQE